MIHPIVAGLIVPAGETHRLTAHPHDGDDRAQTERENHPLVRQHRSTGSPIPNTRITRITRDRTTWLRGYLHDLAADFRQHDPETLEAQLLTVHEGATTLHSADADPTAPQTAREAATTPSPMTVDRPDRASSTGPPAGSAAQHQ
ncbi:hypothetical protein MO973_39965 [Paenibacillus sp. TRM 82003]|nr:hypothetical protein [Paenibacillus sp. TRM 82003]